MLIYYPYNEFIYINTQRILLIIPDLSTQTLYISFPTSESKLPQKIQIIQA